MANPSLFWWEDFKNNLRRICIRHSILESSRKQGQIKALQQETASLSHLSLSKPKDNNLRSLLIKKQTQLSNYLNDEITFLRRRNFSAKGCFPPNSLKVLANMVKTRKSATIIKSLSKNDIPAFSREEVSRIASDFYTELYSHSSDGMPEHPIWNSPKSHLSEDSSSYLDLPISEKEILEALKSLPANSVPGIDGLPREFYLNYWEDIGPLFYRMVNDFCKGTIPPSLLIAATVLIHKKGAKDDISNYRPISLLGTDYKVIAKALSKRISRYLPFLIHADQSGFVKHRNIADTIYSILDTVDFCNSFNQEGYLFLLDLKKAYVTLDRAFLYKSLEHLGFPVLFLQMIQRLHDHSSMRLYINGFLGPAIPQFSGVRQGCPLAPQLFICAIEMFHRFASSRLPVFCPTSIPKSLACYADDITIFLPKLRDLHVAKRIISDFAEVSNEHPNLGKCAIVPLGSARALSPDESLGIPFVANEESERILGVRLSPSEDTDSTWKLIISNIRRKLFAWSAVHPTAADRGRIVNHFLSPVFEFQGKFQPPSPGFWKQLHCLLYNFASQNRVVDDKLLPMLWSYRTLHMPLKQGGVGIISPDLRLHALSVQRILSLLRADNPAAAYSLSIVGLPLGWRSFLAHPAILKSTFPFSVRWSHDLKIFLDYFPSHPPPLHCSFLLQEPLAFNRWILKGKLIPFGLRPQEAFLYSSLQIKWLSIQDITSPSLPGSWRFLS